MGLWELAEAWWCPQAQVLLALGQSQPSGSDYEILGPQPSNWASVLAAVSQRKAVREPTHNKSEAAGSYSWMGPQREPVQCFYFMGRWGGRDAGSLLSTEIVTGIELERLQVSPLLIKRSFFLYQAGLFFWKGIHFKKGYKEEGS